MGGRRITENEIKKMQELYDLEYSYFAIGKKLGRHHTTIMRYFKENKVEKVEKVEVEMSDIFKKCRLSRIPRHIDGYANLTEAIMKHILNIINDPSRHLKKKETKKDYWIRLKDWVKNDDLWIDAFCGCFDIDVEQIKKKLTILIDERIKEYEKKVNPSKQQ